ncbi:hypothetical protein B0A54_11889 [Friedmanniomyces endolithicus]|uniref:F-box domain-containing protein n=1 Tax=Friedmanniomyces endolithicus TaxID=329885 RepID=A0A4U0UNU2_9PEZI|nr:hypothetical protein B0A54_11889 [Friedmanniomyces endolithicus]
MANPAITTDMASHWPQEKNFRRALDNVLAHQEIIQSTLIWQTMYTNSPFKLEDVARAKALVKDIEELKKNSQGFLPAPISPCPDSGEAAVKFFNVTEVFEKILLHLSIPDLHRAEDTSRVFRNTVIGSPKLQRKLFRTTAKTDPLRSLGYVGPFDFEDPWHGYSIFCFSAAEEPFSALTRSTPRVQWKARFQSSTGRLPPLSNKVLDMFVAQPPIQLSNFITDCCATRWEAGWSVSRTQSQLVLRDSGVKLRDLYEIAQGLLEEHRLCPDSDNLNERGFVQNMVQLWGDFEIWDDFAAREWPFKNFISEDDPAWVPIKERAKKSEALQVRLSAYMAAKTAAKEKRQPMFTLQEFEARA